MLHMAQTSGINEDMLHVGSSIFIACSCLQPVQGKKKRLELATTRVANLSRKSSLRCEQHFVRRLAQIVNCAKSCLRPELNKIKTTLWDFYFCTLPVRIAVLCGRLFLSSPERAALRALGQASLLGL